MSNPPSDNQLPAITPPLCYFLGNQLILLVKNQTDLPAEEIASKVGNHPLIQNCGLEKPVVAAGDILTFTFGNQFDQRSHDDKRLQTLPLKAKFFGNSLQGRNSVSLVVVRGEPDMSDNADEVNRDSVVKAVVNIQATLQERAQDPLMFADGLTLVSSAPNWLLSATSNQGGTGGPGARPVLPATIPGETDEQPEAEDGDQEVHVAILDAVPSQAALDAAYGRLNGQHALLSSLYPQLDIYDAATLGITLPPIPTPSSVDSIALRDHDYSMTDHGLFVAGIIHSIAPKAHLHLIQVLNDFGVGTVDSILRGLFNLRQGISGLPSPDAVNPFLTPVPLVINMSLMLDIPRTSVSAAEKDYAPHSVEDFPDWPDFNPEAMGWPLEIVMEWLLDEEHAGGVVVVAAAGNDGVGNGTRNIARYPAAFDSVIGVAALDNNSIPAKYSNLADDPTSDGVATFGGDVQPGNPPYKTDPTNGVLGVYIGAFPDGTPNKDGWAMWAGTSFAAPKLAGMITDSLVRGTAVSGDAAFGRVVAGKAPNADGETVVS